MERTGRQMHDAGAEQRSEAARALGRARTPAKTQAARATAAARRGVPLTEEHKAKLRQAQQQRRERERLANEAAQSGGTGGAE